MRSNFIVLCDDANEITIPNAFVQKDRAKIGNKLSKYIRNYSLISHANRPIGVLITNLNYRSLSPHQYYHLIFSPAEVQMGDAF